MTRIHSLLQAIAETVRERLPDLRACEIHEGRFDLDELQRVSTRAPAVYAACLGISETEEVETEELDANLVLAMYVLTRDTASLSRDRAALNLVETLTQMVAWERWSTPKVARATQVRAENLYAETSKRQGTTRAAKQGVAMWAITWRQKVRLGEPAWDEGGVVPSELYAGWDPDIGLGHEDDYERLTGASE